MTVVTLQEAKSQLEQLAEKADSGEEILISREGAPPLRLVPEHPPVRQRLGFLEGQFNVPDDFDTMFQDEIIADFEGDAEAA